MNSLRGLIPADSQVTKYEFLHCFGWHVKTQPMSYFQWKQIVDNIKEEFGENFLKVYHPVNRIRMDNISRDERGHITSFSFINREPIPDNTIIEGNFIIYLKREING